MKKKHMQKMQKTVLPGLIILGIALAPIQAHHDDGGSTFRGGLLGGITGAAIGGAAGGGVGAAAGAGVGILGGSLIGSSRSRRRDPNYKLDKLYKRRDRLERSLHKAKSERKRTRIQRNLDRVNTDIRSYEGRGNGMRQA